MPRLLPAGTRLLLHLPRLAMPDPPFARSRQAAVRITEKGFRLTVELTRLAKELLSQTPAVARRGTGVVEEVVTVQPQSIPEPAVAARELQHLLDIAHAHSSRPVAGVAIEADVGSSILEIDVAGFLHDRLREQAAKRANADRDTVEHEPLLLLVVLDCVVGHGTCLQCWLKSTKVQRIPSLRRAQIPR